MPRPVNKTPAPRGFYVAPVVSENGTKITRPEGKLMSWEAKFTQAHSWREKVANAKYVVWDEPNERGQRFFYCPQEASSQVINFADIPPGEHLHINMSQFSNPNNRMDIMVWDGVKVSVSGNDAKNAMVKIRTFEGDRYKARNTVQATAPRVNYNCRNQFKERVTKFELGDYIGAKDVTDQDIACRHFTAQSLITRLKKPFFWKEDRLSTFPIAQHFFKDSQMWENRSVDMTIAAPVRFRMMAKHFATFIGAQFMHMDTSAAVHGSSPRTEQNFMVALWDTKGQGHAVHLVLVRKENSNGIEYKVKLFDPNSSLSHYTFATDSLEEVDKLSLEKFHLNMPGIKWDVADIVPIPKEWADQQFQEMRPDLSQQVVYFEPDAKPEDQIKPVFRDEQTNMKAWGFRPMYGKDSDIT